MRRQVVCPNVCCPMDVSHTRVENFLQQLNGIINELTSGDKLSICKPEVTDAPIVELAHLGDNFISRINPHLFALYYCIDAVAAVVGATTLGLDTDVEILLLQVIEKFWPDAFDVVVIASGFFYWGRPLVNHAIAWLCLANYITALILKLLTPK